MVNKIIIFLAFVASMCRISHEYCIRPCQIAPTYTIEDFTSFVALIQKLNNNGNEKQCESCLSKDDIIMKLVDVLIYTSALGSAASTTTTTTTSTSGSTGSTQPSSPATQPNTSGSTPAQSTATSSATSSSSQPASNKSSDAADLSLDLLEDGEVLSLKGQGHPILDVGLANL